ncbi:MAG: hypothetical protein KJ634_00510 [Gammaproteobacteria bacterium]|nr:hypothetical protein [Gammaproteobacteria bacterium]MBU1414081.1 hypothetical protein [Gammaproteobacteria bacterium]
MLLRSLTSVAIAMYAACSVADAPMAAVVINRNHSHQLTSWSGPYFPSFPKGTMPRDGTWLALYCDDAGCEVREAAVAVMGGTIANCDDREQYAETIFAGGEPVAVFNSVNLPLGKVATALLARKAPAASSQFEDFRTVGVWYVLFNGKYLGISWVRMVSPHSPDEYLYRYHLVDGATKQFIFSSTGGRAEAAGGAVAPFVHWAGDLDQDGKVDLLVEIPYSLDHGTNARCQVSHRLYLSSLAQAQEVLHKAAQTSGQQPACACRLGRGGR